MIIVYKIKECNNICVPVHYFSIFYNQWQALGIYYNIIAGRINSYKQHFIEFYYCLLKVIHFH